MLVLLPTPPTRTTRRSRMAGAALALLCGAMAAAAFIVVPAAARGGMREPARRKAGPPAADAHVALASPQFAMLTDSLRRQTDELASIPSILPTMGSISSRFSLHRRHPVLVVTRPHEGVDIAAPFGTPVVAPAAGVVVALNERGGYGLLLELDHGHGVTTRYAHLLRARVRQGQFVLRGQLIANVGNSGLSTGPHLHYEIRVAGAVVDPLLVGP